MALTRTKAKLDAAGNPIDPDAAYTSLGGFICGPPGDERTVSEGLILRGRDPEVQLTSTLWMPSTSTHREINEARHRTWPGLPW